MQHINVLTSYRMMIIFTDNINIVTLHADVDPSVGLQESTLLR